MPGLRPGRSAAVGAFFLVLLALAFSAAALTPDSAHAAQGATYVYGHGNCVQGTYKVPHGVTQISVDAAGASGEDGPIYPRTDNYGTLIGANYGGRGGYGSRV